MLLATNTFLNQVFSVHAFCKNQVPVWKYLSLTVFPAASATQCFAANEILHTSFRWSLLNLLYVLSYGFELSTNSLSECVSFFFFFQLSSIKTLNYIEYVMTDI